MTFEEWWDTVDRMSMSRRTAAEAAWEAARSDQEWANMRRELSELRRDAEKAVRRYEWLRCSDLRVHNGAGKYIDLETPDDFDAAIDAAMQKKP